MGALLARRFVLFREPELLGTQGALSALAAWLACPAEAAHLRSLVDFLHVVAPARRLQRELAAVLWRAIFRKHVAAITALVQKTGRPLPDSVCTKHFGMSHATMRVFLNAATSVCAVLEQPTVLEREVIGMC